MRPILAGIDCEYGILVKGKGAEEQIEYAKTLVESFSNEGLFVGWDYRFENPRNDLRGFELKNLSIDPNDAKYDVGRQQRNSIEVRADRVLPNGGRFYNDHGHPEYATPESFSIFELARFDQLGEGIIRQAGEFSDLDVTLYKNNTDYHGASYGTHESYSIPRSHSFDSIYAAVMPMLVVRQILTGAGKVGSEHGDWCDFQLSQRADFFVESANAETLWRRPVYNARDEPHADPAKWIRLHVISGDANMNPICTALKVGLIKLALWLLDADEAPRWDLANPVNAFKSISRDSTHAFRVELAKGSWTTGAQILESYFTAAESVLELNAEAQWIIDTSRSLLADLETDWDSFRKSVDWATKQHFLNQIREEESLTWRDPMLQAYDLEYSNIDPDDGLYAALVDMGEVSEPNFPMENAPRSRAYVRGIAIQKFPNDLTNVGWRGISFGKEFIELYPDITYPDSIGDIGDVETFIKTLKDIHASI